MKLSTLANGTPDGRLHIVSRDLKFAAPARAASTMQAALEAWDAVEADLKAEYEALNRGEAAEAFAFAPAQALAPMPRAWQWLDGSAFESHANLMALVFGIKASESDGPAKPLMYQGVSDRFYAPTADVPFRFMEDGIDFEGEFGVIVSGVPNGTNAADASKYIRLIVQINDWSLRKIAPAEMKTGFGWVHAKPPCSMAPVAVTPDELGDAWRDNRVALPLHVTWNGEKFGSPDGYAMAFGFNDLVAHAAYSRDLVAGTIIGSGTVSNENYREVGSTCIAERRGIEMLDLGAAKTSFMAFGDTLRMEVFLPDGSPVFGAIDQKVVKAG
ncbi:fumarylacetoacetate hydrolase family protein [Rhizobium sp. C4]|uniref:fumarylacetoacetate hydrolase family protein n=1 Tax=Rhizobium sp. C4 TaxID=1349800 RepID=UPI001E34B6ED|nr:fumarylacetoacetate hydrolase family protein [Rhizobium sp. C4]MCD2173419.1 fumarylacetoacetate hydrolase family protein [Rhizobium sp. C4]